MKHTRFLFTILIIALIGLPQIASAAVNRVSGNGYIFPETTTYKATFSMDVSRNGANPPAGWVKYYYSRTRMNMVSTGITDLTTSGTGATANLSGACTINNIAGYTFSITAIDKVPDSFQQIKIFKPDGSMHYSAGPKNLSGGNLAVTDTIPPAVLITSPANLITLGSSPINIYGTVNDATATVTVNGIPATIANGQFTVPNVTISEGMNTIVARAIDPANNVSTASVNISLDSTPPHIAITSPVNGYKTASSPITVTGIINDIVRGTVNENQGRVLVNGIEAGISNRNFIVESVPLNPGANAITAVGADQWGNTASTSVTVNFDTTPRAMINMVSGNNQSGAIGSTLPVPFVVSVVNETSTPVVGATTIFRVTENNGTLTGPASGRAAAVLTGADGRARATLTLGTWAGSGNNKVEVTSTGVDGSALFTASGLQKPPAAIYVAQGGQQRGAVSQLLPEPLVAYVTDEGHNPLKNVSVIFKAVEGGGLFTNGLDTITISSDSDGRAAMSFILGPKAGNDSNIVEATFGGNTSSPATFMATALIAGDPGDTKISGVVLDNSNNPINNVTMRVEGTTREAKTDTNGQFIITNVPVGPVHLIANGSTAGTPGVLEYPNLMYELTTISGADNTVGMPIYLVPIDLINAKLVGGNEDVTYTIPDVPGFSFTVKANSVTFPDGRKQGYISVTQVHADKVPMVPQIGQQPNFIVTIQPPGTVFDPPAPITIPNIEGLSPGEKTSMYSFDHDLGVFVSIGTGTVSEDGLLIKSDTGTGVVKAGWHSGGNPNPRGFICNCGECRTCSNNACVPLNGIACTDDGDVCTQDICNAGACIHTPAANGTACADDGNSCTDNVCQGGLCSHPLAPNGTSCTDDGDSCTDNVCMGGTCTHPVLPDGVSCADEGNSCTEDKCSGGVCSHPSLPDDTHCPGDGNFCTEDKCTSGVCVHNQLPDGTTCINDNDLCTLDVCKSGSCNHEQQGTGSDQCCNPNTGNVVPKNEIINLDECPNRVERPGFVKSFNGCGPAVCPGCIPDNPNATNLVCLALGQAPSFTQACNIHDLCYDTCGATQMECDLEFLTNMLGFCSFLTDEGCRNICIANANIYAASVGGAGGPIAYIPAQKNACLCCP